MWEGAISQNGLVHEVQIYKHKHGDLNRRSCGTRSDKQIGKKILHVYMDFFFFLFIYLFIYLFYFILFIF